MDFGEFILKSEWPVVVGGMLWLCQDELKRLIDRIKTFKATKDGIEIGAEEVASIVYANADLLPAPEAADAEAKAVRTFTKDSAPEPMLTNQAELTETIFKRRKSVEVHGWARRALKSMESALNEVPADASATAYNVAKVMFAIDNYFSRVSTIEDSLSDVSEEYVDLIRELGGNEKLVHAYTILSRVHKRMSSEKLELNRSTWELYVSLAERLVPKVDALVIKRVYKSE